MLSAQNLKLAKSTKEEHFYTSTFIQLFTDYLLICKELLNTGDWVVGVTILSIININHVGLWLIGWYLWLGVILIFPSWYFFVQEPCWQKKTNLKCRKILSAQLYNLGMVKKKNHRILTCKASSYSYDYIYIYIRLYL